MRLVKLFVNRGKRSGILGGARRAQALRLIEADELGGARPRHPARQGPWPERARGQLASRRRSAVQAEILERGVSQRGVFRQHYETDALDASLLLIPLVRFLPPGDERVRATVLAIADELTEHGLVLRYRRRGDRGRAERQGGHVHDLLLLARLRAVGDRRAQAGAGALPAGAVPRDSAGPLRGGDRGAQRRAARQLPAGLHPPGADQRGLARGRRRAAGRARRAERRVHRACGRRGPPAERSPPYTPALMRAIQIEEFGGPEVMRLTDVPDPEPAAGEVVVEVARAGINFADTHVTRNDYLAKQELPLIPGGEIAGRTPDGRRVAALLANGGYAQKVAVNEAVLVPVPDQVSDEEAAALLLQGLTARSLLRDLRSPPGGRVRGRPGRRRGHRLARRAAREADGRRPGDRARLVRGEARAGAAAWAPMPRSIREPTTWRRRSWRRTTASRSTWCSR